MGKKLVLSFLTFIATFVPLALVGMVIVFFFFGPHTGNASNGIAMLIALVCFVIPCVLSLNVYKKVNSQNSDT